ncbi:lipopolysaccharide biosynthesis protein [Thermodesulfatator autotrophicus]|uniref:Uncharacterized protein n=1 Tax=Thermodesulfatator autotrophicus TaxID=1795632 RepID=A0A177E4W5_9BACT|nr:lipopolysaccharide biosynthesis protein [Thermodesulfatator autotrophicus]OAG27007.1 hypothetical protein TH606_09270 [Thermodesulfatator autotrophicus]
MAEESLGVKAGRAAIWQVAGGGWQTLVRLGASVYLARALKPSDFGLFGMALLYQQLIVTALSMGFGTGLIVKKDITQEDLSTSFWLSCITRTIIFLAVFLTAPLAAMFWKEPRVEPIIRVIAFTLLLQIIGMIPQTLATKNLEFKKLNIIRAVAIVLESGTAIILVALTNLTYWALVIGMMLNAAFYNFVLWFSTGCWRPKFIFHREAFKYLFRFGVYTWLFGITNYLKQNVDYFIVGRLLGTYKLGLYEFAYRLPHLVIERVASPVGGVVFPALSKVQSDSEKIFNGYLKAVKFVALVTFPMLFGLIAIADILVPVIWGSQWLPIIIPLQILSLCAVLRCLFQYMGAIFYCKNRPDLPFKISFITLFIAIIFISFMGYFYGLIGVAIGMLLSVFPSFVVQFCAFRFMLKVNPLRFYKGLLPVLFSSLWCAFSAYLIKEILLYFHLDMKFILIFSVIFGALIYVVSLFVFFPSLVKEVFENVELILGRKINFKLCKIL